MSKKLKEGWDFVKVDQVKEEIGENKYPFYTEGQYRGVLGLEALSARIPVEILEARVSILIKLLNRMNGR